jgi:hypothetical protein
MATPSSYKKNFNLNRPVPNKEYPQSQIMMSTAAEDMKNLITDKDTYLPKGVLHYDLDKGFKSFVTESMQTIIDGKKVPVIMLSLQKWNEFTQTWMLSDEFKNIEMPFITIVRKPNTRPGTNENLLHNIPGNRKYIYSEVPTWDGNRKGVDFYKIPMPTPIDIIYEVRLFTTRQSDLNEFNKVVIKEFRSLQAYTQVNGHYIPILMEDDADESQVEDLLQRRFYVHLYNFTLQGFILDPADFEVVSAVNRVMYLNEKK